MNERTGAYIAAAVLLFLLVLRFVGLATDPPLYEIGHGQAQLTDPYHLTYAARNAVLYDDWNPFDYHRWDVFKNSLISGVAYVLFSAFGVSRVTANLAAVLLSSAGILLFLAALFRSRGRWEAIVAGLILLVNNSLFFYGRMPFLETGLIFISGMLFFVFIRYYDRLWGQIVVGALIALAALAGKLFGLLLLAPVILTMVYRYRKDVFKPALLMIAGLIATGALYLVVFYGTDISILTRYLGEQTTGNYGTPPGLTSVVNFFKMLLTYGGESGLWQYNPFLMAMMTLSVVLTLLTFPLNGKFDEKHVAVVFCLVWLVIGLGALSPFFYRPLRYSLFLIMPTAAIVGYAVRLVSEKRIRLALQPRWPALALVFLVAWYLPVQVDVLFASAGMKFTSGTQFIFPAMFISLLITSLVYVGLRRPRSFDPRVILRLPLYALLVAIVAMQGQYLYRGMTQPGNHLEQYNRDLTQILAPQAVITGPYCPALTIDNDIKGVIYQFGLANKETELFERFPISFVVTEAANWQIARRDFPNLQNAIPIANMLLRDYELGLFRIPGSSAPMTDYERGQFALIQHQFDSALFYAERFTKTYPDNLIGQTGLVRALVSANRERDGISLAQSLATKHSDNYFIQAFCEGFFQRVYGVTNDPTFRQLAERYGEAAKELNSHVQLWERRAEPTDEELP